MDQRETSHEIEQVASKLRPSIQSLCSYKADFREVIHNVDVGRAKCEHLKEELQGEERDAEAVVVHELLGNGERLGFGVQQL